jgi:cysteine desulfurase
VTVLPVKTDGRIDLEILKKAIRPNTILISVMFANNETGVVQPIAAIGRIAKTKGILFHSDAAQALGRIPIDVKAMGIDLLSMSAHKIYGPKGVGALYVRKSIPPVKLVPMIDGGGHEGGFRSGTLNVPGIVGFGKACELCGALMGRESKRIAGLRDRLLSRLRTELKDGVVNGSREFRLPNNLNISFPGIRAGLLLRELKGVAVSSGSACTATSVEPSYVLKALGLSEELRHASIRFGLGRFNTRQQVDAVAIQVIKAVRRLKTREK